MLVSPLSLPLFLIHIFYQRHLWDIRPSAESLVFLFSGSFVWVLLGSTPRPKNVLEYLMRGTAPIFIPFIKFVLYSLFSSSFLVLEILFFSFISTCFIIFIIYLLVFFTSALADGFSLEFEWQQVSSSLQDSSGCSGCSK